MFNAQPNSNGNMSNDFKVVGRSVHSSALDLEEALREVNELVHGRNYQTVDNPNYSRDQDVKRLMLALEAVQEIKELAVDIFQRGE